MIWDKIYIENPLFLLIEDCLFQDESYRDEETIILPFKTFYFVIYCLLNVKKFIKHKYFYTVLL